MLWREKTAITWMCRPRLAGREFNAFLEDAVAFAPAKTDVRQAPSHESIGTRSQRAYAALRATFGGTRLLWIVMLAMHVIAIPGLVATISKTTAFSELIGPLLRIVGLAASGAFFVLKIIDLPCLRVKPGWRSMVGVVLIIGLMHVGVVDRTIGGEAATETAQLGFIALVGAVRCRAAIRHAFRRILNPLLPIRLIRRIVPLGRFNSGFEWTWADDIICRVSQTFHTTFSGPRAPPLSA